jgi:hypothetical protein
MRGYCFLLSHIIDDLQEVEADDGDGRRRTGLYYNAVMDNFTLAVIIGDTAILLVFIVLVLLDKKEKPEATEPLKAAGKRPA